MNLEKLTDEELVALCKSDDVAMSYLLNKYKGMVLSCSKTLFILGGDNDDLVQEGMIGLFKAIRDFDENKNIKFSTFAQVCIKRNIYTAITRSNNPKNDPLNKGVSISHTDSAEEEDEYAKSLSTEELGLSEIYNPEDNLINKEKYDEITSFMMKDLSKLEYQVMDLYIIGLTTSEIAKVLGKNEKTTDNAFQRAKNKIRKFLEDR
ncbi:MAG: sigma-70 family RNA polymerase sigma factor [Lachnospiraceae bacterium]|nr:sigma-70 family RNA polymerase sigma factor [Lachnospiraceae bacterium]MBP5564199.1 sigma-70 family RNA polymerase sigma factor [Lachnospiraceae bacterium]